MIGKIMSEVSHSIIGMLSAKPVDMDTQAPNFDFSAMLSSSDDQYRSVLGGVGTGKPDEANGQRFIDQLADSEGQVNSAKLSLSVEAESAPIEAPRNFVVLEGEPQMGEISETLSLAEQMHFSSVTAKRAVIENPVAAESDQSAASLSKNLDMIDTPSIDPKSPKLPVDEPTEILADQLTEIDNFTPVLPVTNQMNADNPQVLDSERDELKNLDAQNSGKTVDAAPIAVGSAVTSSSSQPSGFEQNSVLPKAAALRGTSIPSDEISLEIDVAETRVKSPVVQTAPRRSATEVSVEQVQRQLDSNLVRNVSADGTEPAPLNRNGTLESENVELIKTQTGERNDARTSIPQVQTVNPDSVSVQPRDVLQNQVSDNRGKIDLPISPIGNDPETPLQTAALKADLIKRITVDISPKSSTPNPVDMAAEDFTKSPAETVRSFAQRNDKAVSAVPTERTSLPAERAGLNVRERSMRAPTRNEGQGYASLPISDVDEPKQNSRILDPIDLRSLSRTDKAVAEFQTTPESLRTLENVSRSLKGEAPRTNDMFHDLGVEQSAQKPRIVDSIDLRLANKVEAKAPIAPSSTELDLSDIPAGGDKKVNADFSMPIKNSEGTVLATPVTAPVSVAAQPAAQRTVSFDWNAPKFAERFAAEISGLSVDGDTKKFEINPRNLGRLEVAFVSRGTAEFIRIEAESNAAREVIVQNSQAIQDMLKAQGRSDLAIRVDVRENMTASANGGGLNLAQHENASTRDDRSNASQSRTQNRDHSEVAQSHIEPETANDSGRYA